MRIGIIGLGRIGAYHAATLGKLDRVGELVFADAIPGMAERAAATMTAKPTSVVEGPEAMFASKVDGVLIAASTDAHLELLRASLSAGIPTFCEKPVSGDPYATHDLAAFVADTGVAVQIGFPRRFDPAFVAAKAALDDGELGWLSTIRSTTMDPAPPPAAYIARSGGIFHDCAIHDFDAVRWASGRDVVEVYAVGSNRGEDWFTELGDADTASTLLTFDDGTIGVVSNTRYNAQGYDVRLELHGSQGSIAAGLDAGLPMRSADPETDFPAGPAHTFFMDRLSTAFAAEMAAFCAVVAGERPSPCTVIDGLEASWVAEAATLSWREHRPVALAELRQKN